MRTYAVIVLEVGQIVELVLTQGGDDLWVRNNVHDGLRLTLEIVEGRQNGCFSRLEFYIPRNTHQSLRKLGRKAAKLTVRHDGILHGSSIDLTLESEHESDHIRR